MDIISALLLLVSASLASARNVLMKSFAPFLFRRREFFLIQAAVFGVGSAALFVVNLFSFSGLSALTVLLGLTYGVLLMCAQWFYTIALSNGKTGICATIYSFGFLLPTLSGAVFWQEKITFWGFLGILIAVPVMLISGINKKKGRGRVSNSYFLPLLIALICSGSLGVVQKIQQGSEYKAQANSFILVAFVFCFTVSLLVSLLLKRGSTKIRGKNLTSASLVGVFFASCNLINTYLAGKLASAVFFPALNIGGILFSLLLGFIIYREKITKKDVLVLLLAAASIILVNL